MEKIFLKEEREKRPLTPFAKKDSERVFLV